MENAINPIAFKLFPNCNKIASQLLSIHVLLFCFV